MPAPPQALIDSALRTAFISHGLTKHEIQEDGTIVDLHILTSEQENLIAAISEGIYTFWEQWQIAQTVAATVQVNTGSGTGATIPAPGQLP